LLLPPGYQTGKQYPLIVMPHGGPQARDRADYDGFAQFLSTRGYIVIKPNFRGSVGSGKNFEQAGYKLWGQRMQDDVDDAADFMIRKGYADPKKIGILGISYGGYSALMGSVKRPDLYKCAVSINGVTHLRDMIESDKKDVDDPALFDKYWLQRIGDPTADKKMLDDNSPALSADRINIPLLVVASEKDDIVPLAQAKTLVKALDKSNKPYSFIKLKESGHNPFTVKKDSEIVHREVEKFFEAQFK
jgi:dipeptidyl aminopeptidase/acylaminoacyl peptidase